MQFIEPDLSHLLCWISRILFSPTFRIKQNSVFFLSPEQLEGVPPHLDVEKRVQTCSTGQPIPREGGHYISQYYYNNIMLFKKLLIFPCQSVPIFLIWILSVSFIIIEKKVALCSFICYCCGKFFYLHWKLFCCNLKYLHYNQQLCIL